MSGRTNRRVAVCGILTVGFVLGYVVANSNPQPSTPADAAETQAASEGAEDEVTFLPDHHTVSGDEVEGRLLAARAVADHLGHGDRAPGVDDEGEAVTEVLPLVGRQAIDLLDLALDDEVSACVLVDVLLGRAHAPKQRQAA